MRNRAKCKLCGSVIESFHRYDYVTCKCEEISISGGNYALECSAKDWANFFRIDDLDNVIPVVIKTAEERTVENIEDRKEMSVKEKLEMLEIMLKNIEELPPQAITSFVTNYDLYSHMLLILSILRDINKQ